MARQFRSQHNIRGSEANEERPRVYVRQGRRPSRNLFGRWAPRFLLALAVVALVVAALTLRPFG
ncbi:MAG TPA: hypothetical protein VGB49_01000 [Caulobacteraceae bacterium]|jgi:hypothetical protein